MSHLYTFPRQEMKARAKSALAGHWKTPILMTLIFGLVTAIISGVYFQQYYSMGAMMDMQQYSGMSFEQYMMSQPQMMADGGNGTAAMFTDFIYFLINLFFAGAYTLAMVKWYLERIQGMEVGFSDFLGNFSLTLKGIGLYIWQQIWLTLWMLPFTIGAMIAGIFLTSIALTGGGEDRALFYGGVIFLVIFILAAIFVGVYKSICYMFIFQAGADAPKKIGIRRALRISIEATDGYRGDLFVLILSFIPWFLLTAVTFGLAGLYVMPYVYATLGEAYVFLRDGGFDTGRFDPEEFNMTMVPDDEPEDVYEPAVDDLEAYDMNIPHPQNDETIYLHEGVTEGGEEDEPKRTE